MGKVLRASKLLDTMSRVVSSEVPTEPVPCLPRKTLHSTWAACDALTTNKNISLRLHVFDHERLPHDVGSQFQEQNWEKTASRAVTRVKRLRLHPPG